MAFCLQVEDHLNREVEILKAELDRLQNDKATLVRKLESKLCKLCGSCSKLCSSCETSNISQ